VISHLLFQSHYPLVLILEDSYLFFELFDLVRFEEDEVPFDWTIHMEDQIRQKEFLLTFLLTLVGE
jgi:hypothetical protein